MKKRTIWMRVGDFLEGKGFYIVLALCLAAIGGSGYYLYRTVNLAGTLPDRTVSAGAEVPADRSEPDFTVPDPETAEPDDPEEEEAAETGIVDEEPAEPAGEDEEPAETGTEEPAEPAGEDEEPSPSGEQSQPRQTDSPSAQAARWSWPLEGEVAEAFSADTLTYNPAMEDWRVHKGIDIAARVGDPVRAAAGGTVMAVKDDVLLGRTVSVQTPDGLNTVYGNLAQEAAVTAGDRVKAGQTLGSVGETAAGEHHDTGWLHFAVERDGAAEDPLDYLEER